MNDFLSSWGNLVYSTYTKVVILETKIDLSYFRGLLYRETVNSSYTYPGTKMVIVVWKLKSGREYPIVKVLHFSTRFLWCAISRPKYSGISEISLKLRKLRKITRFVNCTGRRAQKKKSLKTNHCPRRSTLTQLIQED